MRVDGPPARGLWPPAGGRLCRRVVKGKVLRMDGPSAQGFLSLTAFQAEGCGIAPWAMNIKSALRDWLSMSYGMIGILRIGSLRSPPPIRLRRTSPYAGGRINRSMLSCRDMAPWLSTHSPTAPRGEGGGASHQRGNAFLRAKRGWPVFPRAKPGCPVFAAKGGIYTGAPKGAHLASAAVLHTSRGRSPQPACKASADHRQNPWRPGPSGPAAPSTLAAKPRQPSGIQLPAESLTKAHNLK